MRVHQKCRLSIIEKLNEIDGLPEKIRPYVEAANMAYLLEIKEVNFAINSSLLLELGRRWLPEVRGFQFGNRHVKLTLKEVAIILGLRVKGTVVDVTSSYGISEVLGYLLTKFGRNHGTCEELVRLIVTSWFSLDAAMLFRLYMVVVFGCFFFPQTNGNLHTNFFSLLDDVNEVKNYAWGKAVYDYLIIGLNRLSKKINCEKPRNDHYMIGCTAVLEIWANEHIPLQNLKENVQIAFPRILKWISNNRKKCTSTVIRKLNNCNEVVGNELILTNDELREEVVREALEDGDADSNVLKARIDDLENEIRELKKKLESDSLLQEQVTLSRASQADAVNQEETLVNEVKCLRGELQEVREDRDHPVSKVQALSAELQMFKEGAKKSLAEVEILIMKTKSLEEAYSSQREQIGTLELQAAAANEKLKMVDLSASKTRVEYLEQKRIMQELQNRLADKEHEIIEGENLRKKLHNTILELKGNIRVFCRVRPLLPDDGAAEGAVVSYPTSMESLGSGIDLLKSGKKYSFIFDKVFNPDASQQDVFVEISQLVQSALDGFKVCIFAYGQTGSGKTYTMMGRSEVSEQKGLIPRSLEQIFQSSLSLQAQGWKYKLQASMLEIYNETIRDLLSTNQSIGSGPSGKQYRIKHDANGTYVTNLTIVDVSNMVEISSLLRQATQNRSVGSTQMNEHSSRSHMVFTLRISGINEGTEQQVQGVLNLIDLAGSERLSRTGATGDTLKETQAINKSLSCLSDVIFALAKKELHVPFRDSKLTYLLQPCLGGDSKTLMFVNVSPDPSSVDESLCSLRFAARVNACEIRIPHHRMTLRNTGRGGGTRAAEQV